MGEKFHLECCQKGFIFKDMDKTLKVLAEGSLPSKDLEEDDINPTSSHPYLTHKVQVLDTVQRKDRCVNGYRIHVDIMKWERLLSI